MNTPIIFNLSIGGKKPHSSTQKICPFCHPEDLTHILDRKDDIIWLMNKYPVFEKTVPTVIVETADHDGELSTYSPEKLHEVIAFGLAKWKEMESDKRFRSVIYFRNFGPTSGGSQRHPHSQIIGLEEYDYRDNLQGENFLGEVIYENDDCYASLADYHRSKPTDEAAAAVAIYSMIAGHIEHDEFDMLAKASATLEYSSTFEQILESL